MFITFEGLDYSGKSTQAKLLYEYLISKKKKVILLREPGGTLISEKIRNLILDNNHSNMCALTEFLLFSASRAQLVNEVIIPHLLKKYIVICDRFYDSSVAYQVFGGKLNYLQVVNVNKISSNGIVPNITFLIDLKPKECFLRASKLKTSKDRMENKNTAYFNKVYNGFKYIAEKNKKRVIVINGNESIINIQNKILEIVNKKLNIL
jgi:dTMP kinase